jgi:hypothetical protein
MKLITTSLQALKNRITHSYQPTMLGRWARESCDIKTYRRVDLTNEDHCGVCNYQLENMTTISNKTYMIINDDIIFM